MQKLAIAEVDMSFPFIKKRNISDCILFCGILVYLSLNQAVGKHNPCNTRNLQLGLVSQPQTPDHSKNWISLKPKQNHRFLVKAKACRQTISTSWFTRIYTKQLPSLIRLLLQLKQGFSRRFRDPIRVPTNPKRVPNIFLKKKLVKRQFYSFGWDQWRSKAKCPPGPAIKVPPLPSLKLAYKSFQWMFSANLKI